LPELTIRVCDVAVRLEAADSRFVAAARSRYAPFAAKGKADLALDL
jgi:hypothetical protein